MKRQWDIEELIEHFTLVEEEVSILGSKIGSSRLGCALLLKYFQHEGRFPADRHDIPKAVVDYVARQLKLDAALLAQYDWEGRTIKSHRTQIREHLEFREATAFDTEEMKSWLVAEKLASDQNMEHLRLSILLGESRGRVRKKSGGTVQGACPSFNGVETLIQIEQRTSDVRKAYHR